MAQQKHHHHGRPFSYQWDEERFEEALKLACRFLNVERFNDEQRNALKSYFKDVKDIYFSAPTGHGKSLVFQAIPVIMDELACLAPSTSHILVITPLLSLMHDQVSFLKTTYVTAAAIFHGQEESVLKDIQEGLYSVVYASPESMLSSQKWRKLLTDSYFADNCVGVAVDEAHCITQWGSSRSNKDPFRIWYGLIGELRSLLPRDTQFSVFTATATKVTKLKIFEALCLQKHKTHILELSPVKENLKFCVEYVHNDMSFEEIFHPLITELQEKKLRTVRTLIFCQTRNQAAVIWRTFEVSLGPHFYASEPKIPQNRLVDMFHAGTPNRAKEHILNDLSKLNGTIRVLICTVAFGMGMDCKGVSRILHFGPSKSIESYIQECGRAGRDGSESHCFMLYNGFLQSNCAGDIREYVKSSKCRREIISNNFSEKNDAMGVLLGCKCCDICAENCKNGCEEDPCTASYFPFIQENSEGCEPIVKTREITNEQMKLLSKDLQEYKVMSTTSLESKVNINFGDFHINQVLKHADKIFNYETLKKYVEIWKFTHGIKILEILSSIFPDIEIPVSPCSDLNNSFLLEENEDNAWQDIFDDSELDAFDYPSQHQNMDTASSATLCSEKTDLLYSLEDQINISGLQQLLDDSTSDIEME